MFIHFESIPLATHSDWTVTAQWFNVLFCAICFEDFVRCSFKSWYSHRSVLSAEHCSSCTIQIFDFIWRRCSSKFNWKSFYFYGDRVDGHILHCIHSHTADRCSNELFTVHSVHREHSFILMFYAKCIGIKFKPNF